MLLVSPTRVLKLRFRITPKGFNRIAQGRGASTRTLGRTGNRSYPGGVTSAPRGTMEPFRGTVGGCREPRVRDEAPRPWAISFNPYGVFRKRNLKTRASG